MKIGPKKQKKKKRSVSFRVTEKAEALGYRITSHTKDAYGKKWRYCRYGLRGGVILYFQKLKELKESIELAEHMRGLI